MNNAIVYRLNSPLPDTETLAELLEDAPGRRCHFDEMSHIGFCQPFSGAEYAEETEGLTLFSAEVTKVLLPGKVLKRETNKKLEEIAAKYGRALSDGEKKQVKEAVKTQLIARSHQSSDQVDIRLDRKRSLLVLDVSSAKKADDVIIKLRKVIGSLKVVPFVTQEPAVAAMTRWLGQGWPDPAGWRFSGSCRLTSSNGSHVTFDKCLLVHELDPAEAPDEVEKVGPASEVDACLNQGRLCTEAKFELDDIGEFVLTQSLSLKLMKFSGDIPEVEIEDVDEARRLNYEATALLEWGLIGQVIDDLQAYLGEASIEEEDLQPPQADESLGAVDVDLAEIIVDSGAETGDDEAKQEGEAVSEEKPAPVE
jgi:recombination associated protein RdgC